MAWSIAARDPQMGRLGVVAASRFLAVSVVVPHIRGRVGAIAPQAFIGPLYGADGLLPLIDGRLLVACDDGGEKRPAGQAREAVGGARDLPEPGLSLARYTRRRPRRSPERIAPPLNRGAGAHPACRGYHAHPRQSARPDGQSADRGEDRGAGGGAHCWRTPFAFFRKTTEIRLSQSPARIDRTERTMSP